MKDNIPLFPVAALSVGPVQRMGIIVIRPDFLTHMSQRPDEATTGRHYALTPAQALDLAQQIQKALLQLDTSEFQAKPDQTH